ncbi:MAG: hypothetical protein HUJ84_02865, partial [Veillonella sp.]|nr:hypothetical protein [Veillonella sp.]
MSQRHQVEEAQTQVENILDYDAVLRAAAFEKYPTEQAFDKLKAAHVTALAIYDRTLEKAVDAGQVAVYTASDFGGDLQLYGASPKVGAVYVGAIPMKEG